MRVLDNVTFNFARNGCRDAHRARSSRGFRSSVSSASLVLRSRSRSRRGTPKKKYLKISLRDTEYISVKRESISASKLYISRVNSQVFPSQIRTNNHCLRLVSSEIPRFQFRANQVLCRNTGPTLASYFRQLRLRTQLITYLWSDCGSAVWKQYFVAIEININ